MLAIRWCARFPVPPPKTHQQNKRLSGGPRRYGSFDIIFDHFARISQLHATPHAPSFTFLKKTPQFFTPTLALHAATSTSFWDHFTSHASMHPCHLHTRRVVCRSRTHAYRMPATYTRSQHTVTHGHTRSQHTATSHGHTRSQYSHASAACHLHTRSVVCRSLAPMYDASLVCLCAVTVCWDCMCCDCVCCDCVL